MLFVERQVELGHASGERHLRRQRGEGALDRRGRQAGDGRLAVDGGAVFLEDVESPLREEDDAGLGEDVERRFMDTLDVCVRQDTQAATAG